ncbi:MAG: class I tRNA ligase family protein, partial [Treponema sp.]|nr:class I tRNA ligase family protein [Treponema sp.]
PIGYISITGNLGAELAGKPGAVFQDWHDFMSYWWKSPDEVELFQFIGKDNIPFHTVIFPSSLLGSGDNWTMLHHMSSTEYLNYESGKFSKSRGIGVFGTDVMETGIGPDIWRFYIFYNRPERADALFTWKDFQEKVNGELIGNLGNLVNRTLSFISRYYGGTVPRGGPGGEASAAFWGRVAEYEGEIAARLERAELRDAFRQVFELSSFANKYFQDAEPWRLRKDDPAKAEEVIRNLAFVVRDMAVLMEPYMPAAAARLASFFGLTLGKDLSWKDLGRDAGASVSITSEVLFSKLEDDLVAELRDRYSGSQRERQAAAEAGAGKEAASAAEAGTGKSGGQAEAKAAPEEKAPPPKTPEETAAAFSALLDLRAAKIVKIERHPKADKLYIETLDLGGPEDAPEERVIVSGLVPFYTEEELLGKHIIVAYNLKAAKLRGVESRGMLLAASDMGGEGGGERCEVLDAGDVPPGTQVVLEGGGTGTPPAEISIDEFFSVPIVVKDNAVTAGGRALTLGGNPVKTKVIDNGVVR